MRAAFLTAAVAALLPGTRSLTFGSGYYEQNGQERLLGSSFGFPGSDKTFDYVVVGGGTAGLTVAKRLAEEKDILVAVIEAGGFYEIDSGNFSQIPAYESLYLNAPATIDWQINTSPQSQLGGRSIRYSQGKCLGGSSGRNGMAYQRGTIGSYQAWADAVGDQSYTFQNLMPYFKKSINFTPPDYSKRGGPPLAYDASAFSPAGGPLHVSFWNYFVPVSEYIKKGLLTLGFKENGGIQSGSLLGFAQFPATLNPNAQIRDSSETSFGREAITDASLQIYQRTLAKKILFNGTTASGVRVVTADMPYTLSARKEVILAAGPFRTPQLLMVSGIGPEATLQSLNIPVLANIPGVGQNFQDQPGFGIGLPVNVTTQHQLWSNATYAAEAEKAFTTDQSGPLTAFASNYIAWEHLPNSTYANLSASARADLSAYPPDWPDLQYIFNAVGLVSNIPGDFVAVGVVLMKTTSRGNVTINSTDTANNPVVSVNWLSTSTDQQLAIQGVRRARVLANSFGVVSGPEIAPGPAVQSDAQILSYIQLSVGPSHHAVATCKMGKSSDPDTVVDTHGRVLGGVLGLRIVDASVFPLLPPGQPMSTVYMLAEKLADDILHGE